MKLIPAILLSLVSTAACAATSFEEAVDRLFIDIDQENEPGCAAGVIHKGAYIHKAGYGLASMEYRMPLTSQSVFRTGSIGKQFTAMAVAILAERGDLDLNADVHTYLPDLMPYGHEVTIRQMIHHMSGMGDYDHPAFNKPDGSEFRFGNEDYASIEEFYAMVARADLVFEPGSRYQYSNLAYFLLAHVVERVSGMTLSAFAEAQIFGPLGMEDTLFNDNVNQVIPNRAFGYRRLEDGTWELYVTNLDFVGDGGVFTTLDDFIKWDRNFYDNSLGKGEQALIDIVQTPYPGAMEETEDGPREVSYGFGLYMEELNGYRMIGHTGSWMAATALYHRYPDLALSVVIFCNSAEASAHELGGKLSELAVEAVTGGALNSGE